MEFAKVYQNEANGQKTITLPQTADLKPGFTALVISAGNSYEALPDEMQAQVLLKIAEDVLGDAVAKLNSHMERFQNSERLQERQTIEGIERAVSAVEEDIRRKYVPDDPSVGPSQEEIEEMEEDLAEQFTVEG